jgi:hypothetical protein
MKKIILVFFSTYVALSAFSQVNTGTKPVLKNQRSSIAPAILKSADPRASLTFSLSNQRADIADVKVECSVKNNSVNSFKFSGADSTAHVLLYQIYSDGIKHKVAERWFSRMAAGEEIKFFHTMTAWSNSTEFPPNYELVIIYPNPKRVSHNDGNLFNNQSSLKGRDVNNAIR